MSLLLFQSLLTGVLAARGTSLTSEHLLQRFECPAGVYSVALSPDGRRLAASCEDGSILFGELADGKLPVWAKLIRGAPSLAFSPDGQRLAAACYDRTITVWNFTDYQQELLIKMPERDAPNRIVISPDGRQLIVGETNSGKIRVWNVKTGEELAGRIKGHYYRDAPSLSVTSLALSPNGRLLASTSFDRTARLWDLSTGKEMHIYKTTPERKVPGVLYSAPSIIGFFPEGGLLGIRYLNDPFLRVWGTGSGQERFRLHSESGSLAASPVALSPGGRYLAIGRNESICLLDLMTGQERCFFAPQLWISTLVFSRDGKQLVSASHSDRSVAVWRVQNMRTKQGDKQANWADSDDLFERGALKLPVKTELTVAQLRQYLQEMGAEFRKLESRVASLLKELNDERFAIRQKAERELEALARPAEPILRTALAGPLSLEVRQRVDKTLRDIRFPAVESIRFFGALELLELIGSNDAQMLLEELSKTLPMDLAKEARESANRLKAKSR